MSNNNTTMAVGGANDTDDGSLSQLAEGEPAGGNITISDTAGGSNLEAADDEVVTLSLLCQFHTCMPKRGSMTRAPTYTV